MAEPPLETKPLDLNHREAKEEAPTSQTPAHLLPLRQQLRPRPPRLLRQRFPRHIHLRGPRSSPRRRGRLLRLGRLTARPSLRVIHPSNPHHPQMRQGLHSRCGEGGTRGARELTFPRLVGEATGEADGAGRLPLPGWTFPPPLPSPLLPSPPGFAAAAEPWPVFAMAGGRRLPLRFPEKEMEGVLSDFFPLRGKWKILRTWKVKGGFIGREIGPPVRYRLYAVCLPNFLFQNICVFIMEHIKL